MGRGDITPEPTKDSDGSGELLTLKKNRLWLEIFQWHYGFLDPNSAVKAESQFLRSTQCY